MEVKINRNIKAISVFILDNKEASIDFLNKYGYANLSRNAGTKVINKAVANNMFNEQFWLEFVEFIQNYNEKRYANWIVEAVQIVATIAESINKMVIDAKMALFGRNMAWRQEERNKENEQFFRELAELNAKKEMAIQMNVAQQEVLLKREEQEEKGKTIKYVVMFGLFVAGAFAIAYFTRREKR